MSTAAKRKVIALIRVSSESQADEDRTGIPRQLEDIDLHCAKYGLEVVREYRFEGLSGGHVQNSKRFREMLAELSKPSIAGVVFATLDRFFRPEQLSTYGIFKPFEMSGKRLFCEIDELDPKNSQDQLRIVLYGQMAGFERERIKDRMVRGKNKNRVRADIKSDTLPVGVEFIPDTGKSTGTFRYTEDAQRVREAFERVHAGDTLTTIASDLGWKSVTALRGTLKSHWWIGVKASLHTRTEKKWDEERDRMNDGRKTARDTPIMVDTNLAADPLVSREMFFAVQDILAQHRTSWTQRKTRANNFMCSGLLYCECGRKMYHKADKRPGKPGYYLCSSNYNGHTPCGFKMIDSKTTDRDVWVRILMYTKSEKVLSTAIAEAMDDKKTDAHERTIKDIERKLKTLDKEEKGIVEAIRHLGFNPALAEQMKDIQTKRADLKATLLAERAQIVDKTSIDPKAIARQIKARFWASKDTPDIAERKALLSNMVQSISVVDDAITVRFRVPDSINATRAGRGSSQRRA